MQIHFVLILPLMCFSVSRANSEDDLRKVIEMLVSVNSAPEGFEFPEQYDHVAQEKVNAAIKKLKTHPLKAIPLLIDYVDDKRYCRSEMHSRLLNFTVGQQCFKILDQITNPLVEPNYLALPQNERKQLDKGGWERRDKKGKWRVVGRTYLDILVFQSNTNPNPSSLEIKKN